jgi:manganese/iron transport system permease protein/iron/zinc/copper transport system permease protein
MIDQLLAPFEFEFFRNGLAVATLAGALCGLVGVYVVLKGMSYIGHGLSHAIFGGFAASALLGVNFFLGAGAWGVASALMINGVTRRRVIGADAAIGVITTASFALGLALFAVFGGAGGGFDAALFGSILGVAASDVWAVAAVAVFAVAVVFLRYRALLFATFDPEVADVSGVRTARVDALLMLVLAASILVTMRVLGVTLIAATLVIPATTARMLTNSFARMLVLATAIGTVCGFVGMNLSYHLDVQSGPTIVLVGATLFGAVFAATGGRRLRRTAGSNGHGGGPGARLRVAGEAGGAGGRPGPVLAPEAVP